MQALIYIVNSLLQYLLVTAFILRLILPLLRANMRNPIAQAILKVTNPLVIPLRKVLPPIGRIDTASVVALIIVQAATVAIIGSMLGYNATHPAFLLRAGSVALLISVIQLYWFCVLIYVLMSWIAPHQYNPATDLLSSICEPVMRPIRRIIPPIGGLDLTAVFVLIGLQALLIALPRPF